MYNYYYSFTDENLRELVETYDDKCEKYFSIVYVRIEPSAAKIRQLIYAGLFAGSAATGAIFASDLMSFGVMTAHKEYLCIYVLEQPNWCKMRVKNVEHAVFIYYDTITKLEIKKKRNGIRLEIFYRWECENKIHKIKIAVYNKKEKIKKQGENVERLVNFFEEFKRQNFLYL